MIFSFQGLSKQNTQEKKTKQASKQTNKQKNPTTLQNGFCAAKSTCVLGKASCEEHYYQCWQLSRVLLLRMRRTAFPEQLSLPKACRASKRLQGLGSWCAHHRSHFTFGCPAMPGDLPARCCCFGLTGIKGYLLLLSRALQGPMRNRVLPSQINMQK